MKILLHKSLLVVICLAAAQPASAQFNAQTLQGLFSQFGVLKVESFPDGALVRVDGGEIQRETPILIPLRVGNHTIEVSAPDGGWNTQSRTVTITRGTNTLLVTLTPTVVTGPQGPAGAAGPQGLQGIPGANGAPGATGPQGQTGGQGTPGATGPQGDTGAPGAQGVPGATGAVGPPGQTGATGAAGATGAPGAPGAEGAAGAAGPQGPQGSQGQAGAIGAQGPQGLEGTQGPAGAIGAVGAAGAPGPQGIQGPMGATGAQGLQGIQGGQGAQGLQGPAGPAGGGETSGPPPPYEGEFLLRFEGSSELIQVAAFAGCVDKQIGVEYEDCYLTVRQLSNSVRNWLLDSANGVHPFRNLDVLLVEPLKGASAAITMHIGEAFLREFSFSNFVGNDNFGTVTLVVVPRVVETQTGGTFGKVAPGGAFEANRFEFEMLGIDSQRITSVQGLRMTWPKMFSSIGTSGRQEFIPGPPSAGNITVGISIISSTSTINNLTQWMQQAAQGTATSRDAQIVLFDPATTKPLQFAIVLTDLLPVFFSPFPTVENSRALILSVTKFTVQ